MQQQGISGNSCSCYNGERTGGFMHQLPAGCRPINQWGRSVVLQFVLLLFALGHCFKNVANSSLLRPQFKKWVAFFVMKSGELLKSYPKNIFSIHN
jgi:hypothetical protein